MVAVDKIVPGAVEIQTFNWIQTQTVADHQSVIDIRIKHSDIDLGEAEAIILALELKADLLLIDERRGRKLAMDYGLNVTGLLGVLLQSKHNSLIPAVKPLIDQLIEMADFRVSNQLYATVLQTARE